MKKLMFLVGVGAGFVLGSRAGRAPYEQSGAKVRRFAIWSTTSKLVPSKPRSDCRSDPGSAAEPPANTPVGLLAGDAWRPDRGLGRRVAQRRKGGSRLRAQSIQARPFARPTGLHPKEPSQTPTAIEANVGCSLGADLKGVGPVAAAGVRSSASTRQPV